MLTGLLTIRGFDTAGAVCATVSVFGVLQSRGETGPAPQRAGFITSALQIPIPPPPLCSCDFLKRLAGLDFVGIDLHQLLLVAADPAPIPHQAHGPEQIPLDHEAVE